MPTATAESAKVEQEEQKGTAEEDKGEETEIVSTWEEMVNNFEELGLKDTLLRGIYGYGFQRPSPIQQKGILPLIRGKDTIAQVQVESPISLGAIGDGEDRDICYQRFANH